MSSIVAAMEVPDAALGEPRAHGRPITRGMTKRWLLPAADEPEVRPLLERVLAARGLREPGEIARFCQPKLTDLHDPSLVPGMEAAAARIIDAVRRGQLIAIYGDYDVDGISATAILFHTIRAIRRDARLRTYVPHRIDEGYGLNADALRQLKAEGADLAVSVDCGVTAVEAAGAARSAGLDLIITDHHDFSRGDAGQVALPEAIAVVHPRLPGSQYPFGELCGAGVAFKLAWRLATMWCNSQRVSAALQDTLISMLPLAALATIADVVPLHGENRIIAAFGLRFIKQTPLPGLHALVEASGLLDEKIDSEKVGFVLGPRLNACGRMGHAAEAVRMLTEAAPDEAARIALRLTELNAYRQSVERKIFEEAARLAEDQGMTGTDRRAIVLAHESWHPGVIGIVCSRLAEKFCRPAILLQRQGDVCKGSARSVDGYSIHAGLQAASSHLTGFGGHAMAAGMTLASSSLDAFIEAVTDHANRHIAPDQLSPSIVVDCDATVNELDASTVRRLHLLAPFGRANREPALRIQNVTLAEAPRQIGANGRHLVLRVREDRDGRRRFMRVVWWRAGERASDLAAGMPLDLVIEAKINDWDGRSNVEGSVQDLLVRTR